MKERPILFSAPMVRAILDGKKTQTRRVCKPQPDFAQVHEYKGLVVRDCEARAWCWKEHDFGDGDPFNATPGPEMAALSPYGAPGDRLWVKETWQTTTTPSDRDTSKVVFAADYENRRPGFVEDEWSWRPSIFMPRWASRITLEVTGVRVERLQAITDADGVAEGARRFDDIPDPHPYKQGSRWSMELPASTDDCLGSPRWAFANLWNKINGENHWDTNPWVWVVSFKRIEPISNLLARSSIGAGLKNIRENGGEAELEEEMGGQRR